MLVRGGQFAGLGFLLITILAVIPLPAEPRPVVLGFGLVLSLPMLLYVGRLSLTDDQVVWEVGVIPFQKKSSSPRNQLEHVRVVAMKSATSHSVLTVYVPTIEFKGAAGWHTKKCSTPAEANEVANRIAEYLSVRVLANAAEELPG
jgi:hypothetical protein